MGFISPPWERLQAERGNRSNPTAKIDGLLALIRDLPPLGETARLLSGLGCSQGGGRLLTESCFVTHSIPVSSMRFERRIMATMHWVVPASRKGTLPGILEAVSTPGQYSLAQKNWAAHPERQECGDGSRHSTALRSRTGVDPKRTPFIHAAISEDQGAFDSKAKETVVCPPTPCLGKVRKTLAATVMLACGSGGTPPIQPIPRGSDWCAETEVCYTWAEAAAQTATAIPRLQWHMDGAISPRPQRALQRPSAYGCGSRGAEVSTESAAPLKVLHSSRS